MGKRDDSKQVPLKRLVDMCADHPKMVTFSNRASTEGRKDFGFSADSDIKAFIAENGFDAIAFKDCCESDAIPGTYVSAYTFKIGTTPGYLAYHPKSTEPSKLHIKSFHKDELNPSMPMGTLGDLFPKLESGDENE